MQGLCDQGGLRIMAVTPGKQVVKAPSRGGVPLSRYFLGLGAAALRIRGLHDISTPLEPSALTQGSHDSPVILWHRILAWS